MGIVVQKDDVTKIEVTYPDFSYDCEALAIDPHTRDIFLFTKDREQWLSEVFLASQGGGELQHVATLPLFGITEDGKRVVDVILDGVDNDDWEDIAVNVEDGQSFIYVSDTGDNDHDKPSRFIYKFLEPVIAGEEGEEIVVQKDDVRINPGSHKQADRLDFLKR